MEELYKEKWELQTCPPCQQNVMMKQGQRYCSAACRAKAARQAKQNELERLRTELANLKGETK
jgi:hypothetical protein